MEKIEEALELLSGLINYAAEKNNRDYPVRRTVLNDARAELEELRERLKGIEWGYGIDEEDGEMHVDRCHFCGGHKLSGHKENCWLKAWIGGE